MLSTRFSGATIVLMALALVPTSMHTYFDAPAAATLPGTAPTIAGDAGQPTKRTVQWAHDRFDTDDWFQRAYYGGAVTLTVVRSYDAKRLYHHPELAIAYPDAYKPEVTTVVNHPAPLPIHVLRSEQPSAGLQSIYALQYGGDYVSNALAVQLQSSLGLLVHRRQPMTLVFVRETGAPTGDVHDSRGFGVLLAAVDALARQPR